MTTIAAKVEDGKITMSGDSAVTAGGTIISIAGDGENGVTKLIEGSDSIIGIAGTIALLYPIEEYVMTHPIGKVTSYHRIGEYLKEMGKYFSESYNIKSLPPINYLIAHSSGLYYVLNGYPIPVNTYYCIGSGSNYARTAMTLGYTTHEAVETAKKLDTHTGGDVITIEFDMSTSKHHVVTEHNPIPRILNELKSHMFDPRNPGQQSDYAHSWHANIACAIMDSADGQVKPNKAIHGMSNEAASRIMKSFFNVDTSSDFTSSSSSEVDPCPREPAKTLKDLLKS